MKWATGRQMQHLKMLWGALYMVTLHISCYLFPTRVNNACPWSPQGEHEGLLLSAVEHCHCLLIQGSLSKWR